jgi:siroheme synthase
VRRLQNADLVVHDRDAPAAVLDLVRRDARRASVDPADAPAATRLCAEEARAGLRVVRLLLGDPARELELLTRAGVDAQA